MIGARTHRGLAVGRLAVVACLVVAATGAGSMASRGSAAVAWAPPRSARRADSVRHVFVLRFRYGAETPAGIQEAFDPAEVARRIITDEWSSLPHDSMEIVTTKDFLTEFATADTTRPCAGLDACDEVEVSEGPGQDDAGNPGIALRLRIGPYRALQHPPHPDGAPPPNDSTRDHYTCLYPIMASNFTQCRRVYRDQLKHSITVHFNAHRSSQ